MMITIKEFKENLSIYPDDCELSFSGLDFYRVKQRGDKLIQVEFNQSVYLDSKGQVVIENH
jgi:hypothetical protein